jgi:hypothetical protein
MIMGSESLFGGKPDLVSFATDAMQCKGCNNAAINML